MGELAHLVSGVISGNSNIKINGVSEIQNGKSETITFYDNPKYKVYISETKASAIVVSSKALLNGKDGIVVKNPQFAIAKILSFFQEKPDILSGVHPTAIIHKSAEIGKEVTVGAFAVIDSKVTIGDRCIVGSHVTIGSKSQIGDDGLLYPHVIIYQDCVIGCNVIIHSGTVIGGDGFAFVTEKDIHNKIPQNGRVIIGQDVEIGANCAIDRGTIGETKIGDNTKMDNLIHIAHNVKIGKGCLITAGVGIAGSVEVGDYCIFAGHSSVASHLQLGARTVLAAKTGVTKSLSGGKIYAGMPAREIKEQNKRDAVLTEINILKKRVEKLGEKAPN